MQYVTLGLSILSIIFVVLTFFFNRNDKTKIDGKEEKEEAKSTQYKWGVMETKLDNLSKQVDKILDKLEFYDKEFEEKVKEAIEEHEKRYHNK
jgi:peptidoglycan hydrolase CwlO-like protein